MIGFIGCGKMARAIIGAMTEGQGVSPKEIIVFDVKERALDATSKDFKVGSVKSNKQLVEDCDIIFLAVKPQNLVEVFKEVRDFVSNEKLFVSIAAGISTEELQRGLPKARIVRVMPNLACSVKESMACYTLAETATPMDRQFVEAVFSRAGKILEVEEQKMDAVTVLSGSGPGFIALFLDALSSASIAQGLSEEEANVLAKQTLLGTARLLNEKEISPSELVSMVASKGGVTQAGLGLFSQRKFKELVSDAVKAAVKRSMELGK
ncbi:MAG: pyrroline-5-carboxylate reductase [archaeon]|jgi:pyrroline-5-carboxylate reductase|nr:pyrroline-5-carboxylate reductase [archaeon]